MKLISVNESNKLYVNLIKPKQGQAHLVHYNAFWYGQSILNDDIEFQLIKHNGNYVGVIAFGQFYLDAYLQEKEAGSAEIIHIVIDENHQRQGYGINASIAALKLLQDQNFENIFAAAHPDNAASESLFKRIGFKATKRLNYDSDPLYVFTNETGNDLQNQK